MKNNFIANVLFTLIGLFMLVAAGQLMGLGQSISELSAETFDVDELSILTEQSEQVVIDSDVREQKIEEMIAAPLFNSTREPYIADEEPEDQEIIEEPASPLNAQVTSIVITDESSYVMIKDNVSKERLTLSQGMPLVGEQGIWVVAAIEPRKVRFEAEGMESVELELEVFGGELRGGGVSESSKKAQRNKAESRLTRELKNEQDERNNSAEEIRKKIAERRAEMRKKEAEKNQEK